MIRSNRWSIRGPLIFLFTLLLVSVTAASAQAQGEWRLKGKTFEALGVNEVPVLLAASEAFTLSVSYYGLEITCSTVSIENGTVKVLGVSSQILQLSTCKLSSIPFITETCQLTQPIKLELKDLLIMHGGKAYDLFQAATAGKPIGTVEFKEGTKCPLPLKNEINGAFVAELEAGERKEQPFTFNSSVEALFAGHTLSFGEHAMTLKGKETLRLGAPYENQEWMATEGAQPGQFVIKGKTFAQHGIEEEKFEGSLDTTFTYAVPALGFEINCKNLGLESATLQLAGIATANVKFTSCSFFQASETLKELKCALAGGAMVWSVKLLALKYDKRFYLLAEPSTGETLATIKPSGELCALPEVVKINGSFVAEIVSEAAAQKIVFNTVSAEGKELQRSLLDKLSVGANEATVAGTVLLSVAKGEPWGVS